MVSTFNYCKNMCIYIYICKHFYCKYSMSVRVVIDSLTFTKIIIKKLNQEHFLKVLERSKIVQLSFLVNSPQTKLVTVDMTTNVCIIVFVNLDTKFSGRAHRHMCQLSHWFKNFIKNK